MSILANDLREAGLGLLSRARSAIATLRRTTAVVILLRLLVFGALAVAWMLSLPVLVPVNLAAAGAVALAAALFPRTRAVGFALVTIAAVWVVTTTFLGLPVSLARVLGLTAALYVAHAASALAAVLPHDSVVAADSLARWALRTLLVVAASLGLGAAGLSVAARLPETQSLVAPVLGIVVAAGVVGLIVWLVWRRE